MDLDILPEEGHAPADELSILSALLRCAGLPSTPDVAKRVRPFWIAARKRARTVEANVECHVTPAHTRSVL